MENKKLTAGKNVSKVGMIFGASIIIIYNFVALILHKKIPSLDEQKSILWFGFGIMLIFSPIYLSIFIEKFVSNFKEK